MATLNVFEILLTPEPQVLVVSLGGTSYQFTIHWNEAGGFWIMDIADANGNPLVAGTALVAGCDLLGQYEYLGIQGGLFVQTDNDTFADPTQTNLGVTSHLFFVPYTQPASS